MCIMQSVHGTVSGCHTKVYARGERGCLHHATWRMHAINTKDSEANRHNCIDRVLRQALMQSV